MTAKPATQFPVKPKRRHRLREWSYLKRRRNPPGQLGRPPSAVPLAERRRLARLRYRTRLKAAGKVRVQVLLNRSDLAWLDEKALPPDPSRGATIMRLLRR